VNLNSVPANILAQYDGFHDFDPGPGIQLGHTHIHGELLKLGIDIGETSFSKYLLRNRKTPSQGRKSPPGPLGRIELDSYGLYPVAEFAEFPNHFHRAFAL
jgi:hypothetical protein